LATRTSLRAESRLTSAGLYVLADRVSQIHLLLLKPLNFQVGADDCARMRPPVNSGTLTVPA